MEEKLHTLTVLVENRPGVLAHISGLFSRRAYNIEAISAGYTEEPDMTRITLVVKGDEQVLEQVVNQLDKLIDVIKIVDLTTVDSVDRELVLIKVKAASETRSHIVDIVEIFRANIVDVGREHMIIELTGEGSKIDALYHLLEEYGVIEMVRTGKVAMSRKAIPAKFE